MKKASKPEVAIIMGSSSDYKTMKKAEDALKEFKISFVTKDGVKFKAESGVPTTNFQLCTGHATFGERCQELNLNQIKQLITYLQ